MIDLGTRLARLDAMSPVEVRGRVKEVVGLVARATLPDTWIGELCEIRNPRSRQPVKAEVVGFQNGEALLMPLGDLANIGPASEVLPHGRGLTVAVGEELLGRVLDGLGEPMDVEERGPLACAERYPVTGHPPDPLKRRRVT